MKKMAAQVNFFCFLMFFLSGLQYGTFVLTKVSLTYLNWGHQDKDGFFEEEPDELQVFTLIGVHSS